MDSLQSQKKCSTWVKVIFTLSLLINLIIFAALGYAYYQFKPLIDAMTADQTTTESMDGTSNTSTQTNSNLTPEQAAMLESAGINPAAVPDTITPELENCLRDAVGPERAAAIEKGAQPTTMELIKASNCLK